MAEFDGIITSENDITLMLKMGIDEFIAPKRIHLVTICNNEYPIRLRYTKHKENNG